MTSSGLGYLYQLAAVACWTSLFFLPLIRQPTLVMGGDSDPLVPVANARILAALIPNATLQVFSGGHIEPLADPGVASRSSAFGVSAFRGLTRGATGYFVDDDCASFRVSKGVQMSLAAKLRRAPLRIATGAFILNAGIGKLKADEGTAAALHGMGSGAYPVLKKVEPKVFIKVLAVGEIAVGTALLLPTGAGRTGRNRAHRVRRQPARDVRPHPDAARQVSAPQPGRHRRRQGRVDARLGNQPDRRRRTERITDHRHRLTIRRRGPAPPVVNHPG